MTRNELRKKAAGFYYKNPDGRVLDWAEGRASDEGVDDDVVALAELLEEVYDDGLKNGRLSATPG